MQVLLLLGSDPTKEQTQVLLNEQDIKLTFPYRSVVKIVKIGMEHLKG
jgi:hypothetical protein